MTRAWTHRSIAIVVAMSAAACTGSASPPGAPVTASSAQTPGPRLPTYGYVVVNVFPHDATAFTQGLVYADGFFYESTGLAGQSTLRKVKVETGEVVQRHDIPAPIFAEGLTGWRDQLIQLTWQDGLAFVYDRRTFRSVRTFKYSGEGWGLTHDGTQLILSDGSPTLRLFDPATFQETGRLTVRDAGTPLEEINELEFVKGEIFANVWHTNRIARIDPATGDVKGWIDLTGLLRPGETTDSEAVLNGIAHDAAGDRLFVTGKLWPKVFEIRLANATGAGR